jgi:beta-glucosidase
LRVDGTFGENVDLATSMATNYVEGSQNTYDANGTSVGWGADSITTMIKHWPGDGAGEGGREAHLNAGKYAVYPGNNFAEHTEPFLAAKDSLAVMSSYSIAIAGDGSPLTGNRVGSAYDKVKLDLLRNADYDGVICTDWGVTTGYTDPNSRFGMAWGMEDATVEQRHYAALRAGVDMYGGNNRTAPVLAAYAMWQADYAAGQNAISADERFRKSGERILRMIMAPGLFENPYLDLAASKAIVASPRQGGGRPEDPGRLDRHAEERPQDDQGVVSGEVQEADGLHPQLDLGHGFTNVFGTTPDLTGPSLDAAVAAQYFKKVLTDTPVLDANGKIVDYVMPDLRGVDVVLVGMRGARQWRQLHGRGADEGRHLLPVVVAVGAVHGRWSARAQGVDRR